MPTIYTETPRDPKAVLKEKQDGAVKAIMTKHKMKKISALSKAELDEVITAILQELRHADDAGNVTG